MTKQIRAVQVCEGLGQPELHRVRIQFSDVNALQAILSVGSNILSGHIEQPDYELVKQTRMAPTQASPSQKVRILFMYKNMRLWVERCYLWADKDDEDYDDDVIRLEATVISKIEYLKFKPVGIA